MSKLQQLDKRWKIKNWWIKTIKLKTDKKTNDSFVKWKQWVHLCMKANAAWHDLPLGKQDVSAVQ